MAGIGNAILFAQGLKLQPSTSQDITEMQRNVDDVSTVNYPGNPNSNVSANPSSICHDPVNGNVYFKQSGTGNSGWILIPSGFTPLIWQTISASQTVAVNNGYFCVSPGGALALLLPAVSSIGDVIEIALNGSTSFTVTQGAGQSIRLGNQITTAGVGGSIASTQQGDWIRMVCMTANLSWVASALQGNLTIV